MPRLQSPRAAAGQLFGPWRICKPPRDRPWCSSAQQWHPPSLHLTWEQELQQHKPGTIRIDRNDRKIHDNQSNQIKSNKEKNKQTNQHQPTPTSTSTPTNILKFLEFALRQVALQQLLWFLRRRQQGPTARHLPGGRRQVQGRALAVVAVLNAHTELQEVLQHLQLLGFSCVEQALEVMVRWWRVKCWWLMVDG